MKQAKIVIVRDGPYLVSGNVAISEKIITSKGRQNEFKEGRQLPQAESYALCCCGESSIKPFCDASHINAEYRDK